MIKLIASDIDGTLLQEGSDRLDPEFYTVIPELKKRGILFAAASGRGYASISRLFAPVKDEMIFIADNGSNVVCRGYETFSACLNKKDVRDWVQAMRARGDCQILLSSKNIVYVENADEALLDLLINGYHNNVKAVSYTHLDVYKRQVQGKLSGGAAGNQNQVCFVRSIFHKNKIRQCIKKSQKITSMKTVYQRKIKSKRKKTEEKY